jgi:hypothetical protein
MGMMTLQISAPVMIEIALPANRISTPDMVCWQDKSECASGRKVEEFQVYTCLVKGELGDLLWPSDMDVLETGVRGNDRKKAA